MKLKHTILGLLAAATAVSCAADPEITDPKHPVAGKGLIIEASCLPTTRTDINEGKSTWEAGDAITVVYDGRAYEYSTAEAGTSVTFTSTAGIESYDAAKPLTAYYPPTTAEGTVGIAAERTITLAVEPQTNAAQAPLVGMPNGMDNGGTLKLAFKNIFSVLELRIDAGTLTSKAQSISIEPATAETFDGFITFTGTVDPQTLALTPAADGTGTKMTITFDGGADLTKPQTIKFPVGRFTSADGLKLTLSTEDGNSYSKNIFKSGLKTYDEADGVYSSKHIAKALYALGSSGGIGSADDLISFAAAVNAGASIAEWQDENGVVKLLDDIDMAGVENWTPIGEASFSWASHSIQSLTGNTFKGHFDGDGHTIKNFDMVCRASGTVSNAWGMFGALTDGAIVENIVFDKSCSLTVAAQKGSDTGVLAGFVYNSTVRNIENHASMSVSAEAASGDNVRLTMGVIGFAFAGDSDTHIENVTNYGNITAESAGNTKSGATGVHIAGILGFGSILNNGTCCNYLTECDNHGNLDTKVGRASGIVGTANRGTVINKCTNYGENVNAFATESSARIGNITCLTGTGSKLIEAVNRGDLICKTSGAAGGIVCLVDHANCEFTHCANYGRIITDRTSYRGTFFGQCNKDAVFTSCVAQGDLGTYEGGSYSLIGLNAANYFQYIGDHSSAATHVTTETIVWAEAQAAAEFSVTPATATIDVWGTKAIVAELSAAEYDWTVTSDAWLHATDLSGNSVTEGTKSATVQNIKIVADHNTSTSPRTGTVTFTAKDAADKTAVMTVTQDPVGDAFPSKWVFSANDLPIYGDSWTENHIIPATSGTSGAITAVRGEKYAATPLSYTIYSNKPTVSTLGEGDYWLYTFPVQHLDAGTAIEFDATMGGGTGAPKYYIVEYFEDGEWKSVEEDLRTAPEDASIKYTYRSSGNIDSSGYQHATVMQTIRLAKAIDDGELKIRCRAVGNMTASDTPQDISKLGRSLMPLFGFTGSYVQNLGTAEPKDTKKVLCLGNSFSYYSNPVWMLKEIAYSQGHYMRIRTHLKGSQNFTQHCSLLMSLDAIDQGDFDYAFIQDQSQNPAKYGQTADASILNGATTLAGLIKAKSPQCQIIMEETWAFSASSYGGFESFENFDALSEKGALEMAQANSAWMSPIGKAFKEARKNTSINLYYTDNKHQSEYGAYLKACVNYLVIYGESFTGEVPDCGLDPEKAAYLRSVAEQTVLGHESENLIVR